MMHPSHFACKNGDLEMCRLLDTCGVDWNALDIEMQSPLFYAIESGNLDVIKFLIEEKKLNHE